MLRRVLALLVCCAVAGCGGGDSSSPAPAATTTTTAATTTTTAAATTPAATLSTAEVGRFLTQATFGPTPSDITALQSSTFTAWLAAQTTAPVSSPTHQAWVDARTAQLAAQSPAVTVSSNQFYESFWMKAALSPDELRQRVKFALSQIFVVSLIDAGVDVRGAASYYDVLGADAFVNFRTLMNDVTYHPMMGVYMTYVSNVKESGTSTPDQNYARELMQLMTIGLFQLNIDGSQKLDSTGAPIPTYSQNDILGLAKVFTGLGWYSTAPTSTTFFSGSGGVNADVTPMIVYNQYHSISAKTFLGVTIPATTTADTAGEIKTALDTIFNHPNVGPFIAFRLIQALVTSNPSPAYISRVATIFNNNGSGVRGDMAAVVTAILNDTEARNTATDVASASFGKLREPDVRLGNFFRAFSATSASGNWLMTSTSSATVLGESPMTSPSVFNFWPPGYAPPNTKLAANNLLSPEFQGVDEVTVAGFLNTMQGAIGNGIGTSNDISSAFTQEMAVASDAGALSDRMNLMLLYGQMSATLRTRLMTAINGVTVPSGGTTTTAQINAALLNRAKIAVFLTMASPDYLAQR